LFDRFFSSSYARALATASSAAGRAASSGATENRVIEAPIIWARTAARRTACIDREDPSVQMKKPSLSRLGRATSTEQGAWLTTSWTTPVPNHALNSLRQRYDWIVLDCPPRLSLVSFAALCAADFVVIPLEAADWVETHQAEYAQGVSRGFVIEGD
jgi:hypothetical protein